MFKLTYTKNQKIADDIALKLDSFPDEKLFRIDTLALAAEFGLTKDEIIDIFIQGVYDGFFLLDWMYHCPVCGTIAAETLSINEAKSTDFCPACHGEFVNSLDDNIEVSFSAHPNIREIPAHIKEAYKKQTDADVAAGNYLTWKKYNVLRGIDLIQNNTYRELMSADVLISDQSLQIMKITVLFTDIKGSTQMYSDLGDARAFSLVREHFRILFDVIKEFGGVPVKTIGDAVMGAFVSPQKAVAATLEAQKRLIAHYASKPENEKIEVKIGVHSGAAIIVTLNNRLDYFGSTVNTAARIQASALPNEVVISEELFNDEDIKRTIAKVSKTVKRHRLEFKGLEGEYTVYHIPVCG
ncbi:adenylate/guanylate cyclase domain-containing protein [Treponema sp. OMZ 840]|uniref:adenylate/guanylate cyclase domain-containing protein n=1 Tax=Treponema sp. OMZ 840 TaxID=244313 RepID=UPI003D89CDF6